MLRIRIGLFMLLGLLAAGLAVGNAGTARAATARLDLTPNGGTATAGVAFSITVTAYDASDNVDTSYTGTVHFASSDSGTGVHLPGDYVFTPSDNGTHTFTDEVTLVTADNQTITVNDYTHLLKVDRTWTVNAGPAHHIVISPGTATITAGSTQAYTAVAYDVGNNNLGDVTGSTSFAIVEAGHGGSWSTNTYTSAAVGTWTVRGTYGALTNDARLNVNAGAADYIVISPSTATITAGSTQGYTAQSYDQFDNPIASVTSSTTFSITAGAGGSWAANVYTSAKAGTWTVTGTYSGLADAATLNVNVGPAHHIAISPDTATITAGSTQGYTAQSYDQFDNPIASVTSSTTFSITAGAGGSWAANVYASAKVGSWTVTGSYSGLTDTAALTVSPAAAVSLALAPTGGSAIAGISFSITVTAHDTYGNVATGYLGTIHFTSTDSAATLPSNYPFVSGDVGAHTFSVTLLAAGNQSVAVADTGNAALSDAGTWSVSPSSSVDHIVISPGSGTTTAGSVLAYTAEAFDQWDNSLGDVTSQTSFNIDAAAGSFAANVCTSQKAGTWTVTGTYSVLSNTAILVVNAGAIDHYDVGSSTYSQQAGIAFTVTVTAYDAFGNLVNDNSTTVAMSSDSPGVSFDANADGVFDDSAGTLANGTFTIAAKCSGAVSAMMIVATSGAASGTSPVYSVTADQPPVALEAADDSYHVPRGTVLMSSAPGVLANDTGAEGDSVTAILVGSVSHGTLMLKPDGSFTYTPESDFSGTDSFTYRAVSGAAESNIATVSINVGADTVPQTAGVSPWIWAGPLMAVGLLGSALALLFWYRRGRVGKAAASAPAAASRAGIAGENGSKWRRAKNVDGRRELDSVTALKDRMARLNQTRDSKTGSGSG